MPVLYFHMTTPRSFPPPRYLKFGGGGGMLSLPSGKMRPPDPPHPPTPTHPIHPTHPTTRSHTLSPPIMQVSVARPAPILTARTAFQPGQTNLLL